MRKTTTSLATFCSAAAVVVAVSACGKRGDPLPPLRPFPAAAEGLTIRQIGNRIQLQWVAPSRNTDGTTEKLELAEVEVRRRILDIAALVEEQTETIEPEEAEETDPEEQAQRADENVAAETEPTQPAAPPPEDPTAAVTSSTEVAETGPDETTLGAAGETLPSSEEVAKAPAIPVLVIPNFGPQSRDAATLESTVAGETNTFEEDVLPMWIGKRVEYAVIYVNRGGRRGERSAIVRIEPSAGLSTPGQPVPEVGDGFVELRWSAAEPEPSEAAPTDVVERPAYYSVFRRPVAASDYPSRPLNAQPLGANEFVDRSIAFGVGACYIVKSVAPPPVDPPEPEGLAEADDPADSADATEPPLTTESPELDTEPTLPAADPLEPIVVVPEIPPLGNEAPIESEPSPEVCLVPTDTFAPPAPSGLVAVRSGADVLLTWTEVERSDVAGYRVYRSESPDGPFELLNEDLLRVPTYTDDTVAAGETYYYGITAIDDAPAANESEMSELSDVTFVRR